jgi:hypothetical protein
MSDPTTQPQQHTTCTTNLPPIPPGHDEHFQKAFDAGWTVIEEHGGSVSGSTALVWQAVNAVAMALLPDPAAVEAAKAIEAERDLLASQLRAVHDVTRTSRFGRVRTSAICKALITDPADEAEGRIRRGRPTVNLLDRLLRRKPRCTYLRSWQWGHDRRTYQCEQRAGHIIGHGPWKLISPAKAERIAQAKRVKA